MKNLKDALSVVINIGEKTDEALADGNINIAEGVSITMSALGLIKVVKNAKEIKKEFIALTSEQKTELSTWFSEEFDIINDNTESIIEMVFNAILQLGDVFALVAKKEV